MAKTPAVVAASDINVEKGLKKDVDQLYRYVQQQAPDAADLLERCIRVGSKKMREAAWPLLARANVERAEALALEMADVGERSKNPKQRAERFAPLLEVATSRCLDRAEALGLPIGTLFAHQLAGAVEWLQRSLARERERGTSADWLRPLAGRFSDREDSNAARDWFESLLDAPDSSDAERMAVFEGLIQSRYLPVLRRADLPEALVPAAAFALPSSECFDRLAPHLDRLPGAQSVIVFAKANMMWHPADDRWLAYWLDRFTDATPDEQLHALRALKDATRVDTKAAIHVPLGHAIFDRLAQLPWTDHTVDYFSTEAVWAHPAAVDVWLKGVAHASETYNDRGHRSLAGLLRKLHARGRAEHVAILQRHAQHVASITGGSQAAAAWFAEAIAAIRQRTGG